MELYGSYFKYAGVSSRIYDLIFANVNTERFKSIIGETETLSVFNRKNKKNYYAGTSYLNSPVSFEAEIISNGVIPHDQLREIERWLFYQHGYKKLYVDNLWFCPGFINISDSEDTVEYINCRFVNPEKIECNGIIGWKFTVECDAPMVWRDPEFRVFTNDEIVAAKDTVLIDDKGESYEKEVEANHIMLNIDTDLPDYVHPSVEIVLSDSSLSYNDIRIINHTDDSYRITGFSDVGYNATINMNGNLNMITGGNDNYYELFTSPFFVRLVNGDNDIEVVVSSASSSGASKTTTQAIESVKFTWQNMRWF